MDLFLQQHDNSVTGILRGWDRLRFRGTQRMLSHVGGLNRFLQCTRRLIKDFGDFAQQAGRQIRAASLEVAELADRPVIHLDSPKINKEQVALDIAKRDGIEEGLVAAITAVETPLPLKDLTGKLSDRVKFKNQHVRGLNLLGPDSQLLRAIGGEFLINGFRNRDMQAALFKTPADDPAIKRKRSGQMTRKLRLLRAHGLIQKVPHTHRCMVSPKGRQVIAAIHAAAEADIQKLTAAA
jgi:hypothetical protein